MIYPLRDYARAWYRGDEMAAMFVAGNKVWEKPFNPLSLFANGEQGVWYDPSDLTTLFQDHLGTIPAAYGQPVGLILDKSKGLALGPELVANGDFTDNNAANWTLNTWAVRNNRLEKTAGDTAVAFGTIEACKGGVWYRIEFDAVITASTITPRLRTGPSGTQAVGAAVSASGHVVQYIKAIDAHTTIQFGPNGSSFEGSIDNISVREIPGNHASQATATARPTLGRMPAGGVRNLLTSTEDFGNAVWSKAQITIAAGPMSPVGPSQMLVPNTANAWHSVYQAASFDPTRTTHHAVCKAAGYGWVQLLSGSGEGLGTWANFDLLNGAVGNKGPATLSSTITSLGDGWWLCSMTTDTPAATGGFAQIGAIPNDSTGRGPLFAGDGVSGVYVAGSQKETGTVATPYQRVGTSRYDVTEDGVQSLSYLYRDPVDDALPWMAPAGSYDIVHIPLTGPATVLAAQALSGTANILLAENTRAYLAIDRRLTAAEIDAIDEYYGAST